MSLFLRLKLSIKTVNQKEKQTQVESFIISLHSSLGRSLNVVLLHYKAFRNLGFLSLFIN